LAEAVSAMPSKPVIMEFPDSKSVEEWMAKQEPGN
jgi:hypothetical protein